MNCHRAVKKGSEFGTQELTKIFVSIGYDPSTDQYIDNYDKLSNEEIKAIYTRWIADNYNKDNSLTSIDRKGERTVAEQWKNIETSLTNDLKEKVSGPIEWTRIHMLPDHVYFNHSQHVTVGKSNASNVMVKWSKCRTCINISALHGLVRQLPSARRKYQFAGNDYYNTYKQYHDRHIQRPAQ
jgi:hypothetical protein